MVTIVEQPNEIMQSKNPIVFKFQTDNYILTPAVNAVSGFLGFNNPDPGDTILFEWEDHSIEFTFATTLDSSGLKLRTNTGALTTENYVQTILIPDLKTNNDLYDAFTISYFLHAGITPAVKLTSKLSGEDYTLAISAVGIVLTATPSTAGVSLTVRENFKIYCDVYAYDSLDQTIFSKLISLEGIPDNSNQVTFDLSPHLDKYVLSLKPTIDQTSYLEGDVAYYANTKKYFVRYGESYGIPSVSLIANTSAEKYAILGGRDYLNFTYSSFVTLIGLKKTIQSTQPATRYVSQTTPALIYTFRSNAANLAVRARVKFYYSDNTSASLIIAAVALTKWAGVIHNVSYGYFLNIPGAIDTTKTLLKYEVYLDTGTGLILSDTITYIMDYMNYEYERYFLYENSQGGFDVLRCIGPLTETVIYDPMESRKITLPTYSPEDHEEFTYNTTKSNTFKISTGYHTRDFIKSLEDFFLSKKVYLISESGSHIPVNILSKKAEKPGDLDQMFAIDFEFKYAFTDKSFTP
jgi:uncharacterized membrane protein